MDRSGGALKWQRLRGGLRVLGFFRILGSWDIRGEVASLFLWSFLLTQKKKAPEGAFLFTHVTERGPGPEPGPERLQEPGPEPEQLQGPGPEPGQLQEPGPEPGQPFQEPGQLHRLVAC